ncbi:MAG: 3-deoxy-7-phosphoheptulonate synthase, partial [Acidiferrobacterales bacterium]
EQLKAELPLEGAALQSVKSSRDTVFSILDRKDPRLFIVVGPCSIHDTEAAIDYANRLKALAEKVQDTLYVVMRVYFEKPRTAIGWKGLINDPNLDGSFQINKGLRLARELLLDLNNMGIPAGTEFLELVTPQYFTDLVSWGAIGARTTESQVHREMASGLSCPVGFKNGTDGNLKIAIDAVRAAREPHHFLSLTKDAHSAIFSTSGNADCHIILRGGYEPNYDPETVRHATEQLEAAGLPARLMIDFSHANSRKRPERQLEVGRDVAQQIVDGNDRIMGVMIESHLKAGRQDVIPGQELVYGQSITDACLGWDESASLLQDLADALRQRRSRQRTRTAS